MFDVSWTDPAKETVGERRTRKKQNGGSVRKQGLSRRSSMRSSRSAESSKPSLLNLFGQSRKPLERGVSQSKLASENFASTSKLPEESKNQRLSTYTTGSESSAHELPGTSTTRIPENEFFEGRESSDAEQSNASEPPESVFSGWTERSSRTDSSWSSVIDSSTLSSRTSSRIVQPLSPNSFVTQSTEVTVSPRECIKAEEHVATIVHISAAGSIPVRIQDVPDSPSKKTSPPSIFAFPLPLPLSYAYPPSSTSPTAPNLSYLPAVSEGKSRVALKKELSLSPISLSPFSTSYSKNQPKPAPSPLTPWSNPPTKAIPTPTPSTTNSNQSTTRWPTQSSTRSIACNAPSPIAETWQPPSTWECLASMSSSDSSCSLSPTTKTHPRPRVHHSVAPLSTTPSIPRRPKERDGRDGRDGEKKERRKSPTTSPEILQLQRSMRRMGAASKKIILERLREEWTEVADASVYRELELEKQMWMLTALRSLDGRRSLDGVRPGEERSGSQQGEERRSSTSGIEGSKVLSLFENHASASSLAAVIPSGTELHHLSIAPLSPTQYPNILPLTVPAPTPNLPFASGIFSSIHAFNLPSLLPASSIPTILSECHRILTPPSLPSFSANSSQATITPSRPNSSPSDSRGGALHLTILDPSPLPGTLGPRLRTWLDDHLVLNLEKQFRCINPSRLFPGWLADAGLRAEGSTVMYVKFFASVPLSCTSSLNPRASDELEGGFEDVEREEGMQKERGKEREEERVKQELKSVVGRMLWKEIWGSFVLGSKWWWEDESVVDECERMGTVWEYAVIDAVKGE
ncbi:uncharacterized protein PAC_17289 [Phialocephala subalpina]|uniref:Uncharacterized protein n=1 Tax=Phialocephala subalpina TaxID=576137 RepID=A0A1L7XQS4_9HELO|nr:uncharacterized protein PAC_17289 [Phialocephala subalpina]